MMFGFVYLLLCLVFICLLCFVLGFFGVHTLTSPLHPQQAKRKQMNKRKAGNEYEKFSGLYVYMNRFSEPAFSIQVLFQTMPRSFGCSFQILMHSFAGDRQLIYN